MAARTRCHIFSHVLPSYERVVSNLDRPMHRSLWVLVAHSSFIEGSHTTKNTASDLVMSTSLLLYWPQMFYCIGPVSGKKLIFISLLNWKVVELRHRRGFTKTRNIHKTVSLSAHMFVSQCLNISVSLLVSLLASLLIYLSVCMLICLLASLSLYLPVCMFISFLVSLFIYLSVCSLVC